MNHDIFWMIALHLDYIFLGNLWAVNKNFYHISCSNYFWLRKCIHDLAITEEEYDSAISEVGTGQNTYLFWAGELNLPIPGAERYGNLYTLAVEASKVADDLVVEYFYRLSLCKDVWEILGLLDRRELITRLMSKYSYNRADNLYGVLMGGIRKNNLSLVTQLLTKDTAPYIERDVEILLTHISTTGSVDMLKYINQIYNYRYQSKYNDLLCGACIQQNLPLIHYLLAAGVTNYNGGLSGAAISGNILLVKWMLKLGATAVNRALSYAATGGHIDIISELICRGATDFNSGLTNAAYGGHISVVQDMVARGATDINGALDYAVMGNQLEMIHYLINIGANNFSSALEQAIIFSTPPIVSFLLTKTTPSITYFVKRSITNDLAIFNLLIDHIPSDMYQELLILAALYGKLSIFRQLIAKGANPLDVSVMREAACSSQLNIILDLIKRGASYQWAEIYMKSSIINYLRSLLDISRSIYGFSNNI